MPELDDKSLSGGTQDGDEEFTDVPADHPLRKALKAEREKRKQAEAKIGDVQREADEFIGLKARFPEAKRDWLTGRPVEEWEPFLTDIYQLRSGTTPETQPAVPAEAVTRPEEAVLAHAQGLPTGRAAADPTRITLAEAEKIPWGERRELIRQGRVEGVSIPTT